MPLLARRVDRDAAWADAENQWSDGDFPYEVLFELRDGRKLDRGGLSFFSCSSQEDLILFRLAAAFYMEGDQNNDPKKLQFRFVHTDQLEVLGIPYFKTKGKIPDAKLQDMHYDVRGLTGDVAIKLAKLLIDNGPKIIKQDDVIRYVAKGLRLGWHEPISAKDRCLSMLNKRNALKFDERKISAPKSKGTAAN